MPNSCMAFSAGVDKFINIFIVVSVCGGYNAAVFYLVEMTCFFAYLCGYVAFGVGGTHCYMACGQSGSDVKKGQGTCPLVPCSKHKAGP